VSGERSDERLLFELKSRGPQSTQCLAKACALTAVGARKALERLAAQGLVEAERETQRGTAGRPAWCWRLTGAGHARFPDRHAELSLQLLGQVRLVFGESGLDQLMSAREAALRRSYLERMDGRRGLAARLRALAALRSEEGYMARLERAGRDWLLIEDHCPVCAAATQCQGLCRSELALFQACTEGLASVTRVEHLLADARRCVYRFTARRTSSRQETM
jgi:predicted ArsR family transcriptional regulator